MGDEPPIATLRLTPNVIDAGETAALVIEHASDELLGAPVTVELLEVDEQGGGGVPLARFQATIEADAGGFRFGAPRREALPGDRPQDGQDPAPKADTSRSGVLLPFETTWRQAAFRLQLAGEEAPHRIALRVADVADAARAEGARYELGIALRGADGQQLFSSGSQVATVDCWPALVHDAVAAAVTQLQAQHYLVETKGEGDWYGVMSGGGSKRQQVTSCINFCLQVLQRAYQELGAKADARLLKGAEQNGGAFAKKIRQAGWRLLYFHRSRAEHLATPQEYRDAYWRINQRALTDRVFKTYQPKDPQNASAGVEVACEEPLEEVVHSYGGADPDPAGVARFDALGAQLPFAVVALGLGDHMALKVGERIYQCHWSEPASSARLFERVEQSWEGLKEGGYGYFFMAVPDGYLDPALPGQTEAGRRRQLAPDLDHIAVPTGDWRPSDIVPEEPAPWPGDDVGELQHPGDDG